MIFMMKNFRLVPKFNGKEVGIFCVMPDGDGYLIAKLNLPNDNQQLDDMKCVEEICVALKKRIRKSV